MYSNVTVQLIENNMFLHLPFANFLGRTQTFRIPAKQNPILDTGILLKTKFQT